MKMRRPPTLEGRQVTPDESAAREEVVALWHELDAIYTAKGWEKTHRDIIDFIQPGHGQFDEDDTNNGERQDARIINNAAGDKAKKLSAAIGVAVTPEAREWFVVEPEDDEQAEDEAVRDFCYRYQRAMFAGLSKVGFYAPNRNAIDDCVGPSISLVLIEEVSDGQEGMARCIHVPVGQYRVGCDAAGNINAVVRRFRLTAAQMAKEFGEDRCSPAVRAALKNKSGQTTQFTVVHCIRERKGYDEAKVTSQDLPWASEWVELGQGYTGVATPVGHDSGPTTGPKGLLRVSGFNEQPFYSYRWNQLGQDAYGKDSPGWNGLGDAKQLQDIELGSATMLALLMKPPMNRPDSLANASLLPGADNPVPDNSRVRFEPSFVLNPDAVAQAREEKRELILRLNNTFFGDVLFMLSGNVNVEPKTAEEIRGIKEERLLQLGSVSDRITSQLTIALKRFAGIFQRAGLLPEAPQSLLERGGGIRIQFVNPLVAAQKAMGFQGMQQAISVSIALGEEMRANPQSKLDHDEVMESVVDMLGIKPNTLMPAEKLAAKRKAQADQQNALMQQQSMTEAAPAIQDLSNTDPEKLRQLLQQFGPNAVAQGAA